MQYNNFEKLRNNSRSWLDGISAADKRYFQVIQTLEEMLRLFDGNRNNGDVEAIHPLGIFAHMRQFHHLLEDPITLYMVILMHDALEDKRKRGVNEDYLNRLIGGYATEKVILLTKEEGYVEEQYHQRIWLDSIASLGKGGDRVNNNGTAISTFKPHRLYRYRQENVDRFIPGFKISRLKFPQHAPIFHNMKMIVHSQVQAMDRVLEGYTPEQAAADTKA